MKSFSKKRGQPNTGMKLLSISLGLWSFQKLLQKRKVVVNSDNTGAEVSRLGRCRFCSCIVLRSGRSRWRVDPRDHGTTHSWFTTSGHKWLRYRADVVLPASSTLRAFAGAITFTYCEGRHRCYYRGSPQPSGVLVSPLVRAGSSRYACVGRSLRRCEPWEQVKLRLAWGMNPGIWNHGMSCRSAGVSGSDQCHVVSCVRGEQAFQFAAYFRFARS